MEHIIFYTSATILVLLFVVYLDKTRYFRHSPRKILITAEDDIHFAFLQNKMSRLERDYKINGLKIDKDKRRVEFYSNNAGEYKKRAGYGQFGIEESKKEHHFNPKPF